MRNVSTTCRQCGREDLLEGTVHFMREETETLCLDCDLDYGIERLKAGIGLRHLKDGEKDPYLLFDPLVLTFLNTHVQEREGLLKDVSWITVWRECKKIIEYTESLDDG